MVRWRNVAVCIAIVLVAAVAWSFIAATLPLGASGRFLSGMVVGAVSMSLAMVRFPIFRF